MAPIVNGSVLTHRRHGGLNDGPRKPATFRTVGRFPAHHSLLVPGQGQGRTTHNPHPRTNYTSILPEKQTLFLPFSRRAARRASRGVRVWHFPPGLRWLRPCEPTQGVTYFSGEAMRKRLPVSFLRSTRMAPPEEMTPGVFFASAEPLFASPEKTVTPSIQGAAQKSGNVQGCHRLLVNRCGWWAAHGVKKCHFFVLHSTHDPLFWRCLLRSAALT